jgi:DNA-binding transcriptional ArsR family regulator
MDLKQVDCCEFFRVLSDPTRLRVLEALRDGERCVSEIVKQVGLPQPVVSHHLGILRRSGLVKARREGKQIHYRMCCDCLAHFTRAFLVRLGIGMDVQRPGEEMTA